MIYENKFGKINFWDAQKNPILTSITDVVIPLSGGMDSSLSLYMMIQALIKKKLHIRIHTYSLILIYDKLSPKKEENFIAYEKTIQKVLEYFKNRYSHINLHHNIYKIQLNQNIDKYNILVSIRNNYRRLIPNILPIVAALKGPPSDTNINPIDTCKNYRIKGCVSDFNNPKTMIHLPFGMCDKRFIYKVYIDEKLDELLKITRSCARPLNFDTYSMEPCGTCFGCKEREWASRIVRKELNDI